MTRRITIARDGTVKLRGKATRWRVDAEGDLGWVLTSHVRGQGQEAFGTRRKARAYLESLTDEELMEKLERVEEGVR